MQFVYFRRTHSNQCTVSELEILTQDLTSTTPGFIWAYTYICICTKVFVSFMTTFVYTFVRAR